MWEAEQKRMRELHVILKEASRAYYANDEEIMSNFEYDKLYDELVALEEKTGIVLSGSPTVEVGYEAVDFLPKERHVSPMLSLAKTKSRGELADWLGEKEGLLSWKLDGLTIVLTYENGELQKAVTRGNGEVGEIITPNAKMFLNLPLRISYKGTLVLRGEAVIGYGDFKKINEAISDPAEQYKNPRNLCSGSVRQLNNEITKKRNVRFFAFSLVNAEGVDFRNSREEQMNYLKSLGFETVFFKRVNRQNIQEAISWFEKEIESYDIPSDGLVLTYDDIAYAVSLGNTAKSPRGSIAFKWQDEIAVTTLKYIEWSPSRTGLINPVAVFEPVELEGTTVSRASVHNVSVMRSLKLGIGDKISVYKANMIIPQIAENLTCSDNVEIPEHCPVCGKETMIQEQNEAKTLMCLNPECPVKKVKAFTLFVSRDAMNFDGLSEMTIEKFTEQGIIKEYADFYKFPDHKEKIVNMEGFGETSYRNLVESAEKTRKTTLAKVLCALGIAGVGVANAKLIARHFDDDISRLRKATKEEISEIDGVGDVIGTSITEYFANPVKTEELDRLLNELEIVKTGTDASAMTLTGKTFVITGSLNHFKDRSALKERIEAKGGKVSGSVSSKTECLINNDVNSGSSKNKSAKSLGIEILSEEDFLAKYGIDADF
ncbi:MAG: NAD-dependent DNA ligase LigA [Lachnospiraceae bacterium]|nr:NAD-dependent DNA ligase LigA [Lachnospiraceae bacterium]